MRLLMVDEDGCVVQEYAGVTAQIDGMAINADVIKILIPGEGDTDEIGLA